MPHRFDKNLIQFLVVILFFVGGAIINWLKQRGQPGEPHDTSSEGRIPPTPRPARQPANPASPSVPKPTPRKIDWEAELRRMLGEPETTPPPPLPPEPLRQEPRRAALPPAIPSPSLPAPRPALMRPVAAEPERGLPVEFAGLTASAQSYAQASQLDVTVAEHLRQISQQVKQHRGPKPATASSLGVAQTLALLRNRRSLRSVIMASMILGPPKSLGG